MNSHTSTLFGLLLCVCAVFVGQCEPVPRSPTMLRHHDPRATLPSPTPDRTARDQFGPLDNLRESAFTLWRSPET